MAVTPTPLIQSEYAPAIQTSRYTADAITIIDSFTIINNSGAPVAYSCNLVPSGGAEGADNKLVSKTLLVGESYSCPEMTGQTMAEGDYISTLAGLASTITQRASGRKIS